MHNSVCVCVLMQHCRTIYTNDFPWTPQVDLGTGEDGRERCKNRRMRRLKKAKLKGKGAGDGGAEGEYGRINTVDSES